MKNKKVIYGIGIFLGALLLTGCTETANLKEQMAVNDQQKIYVENQPAPFFDWSLERHLLIKLYEERNKSMATYSYVRNFEGKIIFECKSIGFPIPADTQLTNPSALAKGYSDTYSPSPTNSTLPQAEPNGLYTSQNTQGTYVFCLNSDGTVSPSYFEVDVESHVAPIVDGKLQEGSFKITTTK